MPKVNTKIYYNNTNGEILLVLNQNEGPFVQESSFEKDLLTFDVLKGISRNVISVLKLAWDQHKEDFMTQQAVKVVGGEIKWQPFNPAPSQPPDKPFSEKLADAEKELARQREVNIMMNNDISELVNYLMEAGVL